MSSYPSASFGCALLALCLATEVQALNYKVIPNDGAGKRVLLAYDCGFLMNDPDCPAQPTDVQRGFAPGELDRLRRQWSNGPFAEVWLLSGGGTLNDGIDVANELRNRSQTVRVPNVRRLRAAGQEPRIVRGQPLTRCISSCTVAFMGGQFRFIDLEPGDEATYEVHAGSTVMWDPPDKPRDVIERNSARARSDMIGLVAEIAARNRATARRLFTLFQETLWLVIKNRSPNDPERRAREEALDRLNNTRSTYAYPVEQQRRDREIHALEGDAALQDILMRVERQSMMHAVEELRNTLPALGRRADAALAMLAAMYDTSGILETNRMPKETLLRMGYITAFVDKP